ncbi:MAG: hypothetical protein COA79_11620 [Planctomycetota bacterium]|nr:MAG: hypothetical protein COA79_11620 [Planctomycetota bacterium]
MTGITFSPRVVGTLRPDYHSLESILKFEKFKGKANEELVLAIYDFFTDTVDGTYHYWPSGEKEGNPLSRFGNSDPIKLLNCYGWMICGQNAEMMQGLYQTAGFKCRTFAVPGHVLCEVYYDDRWHILDVDMWTWFRTPEGHIASAFELACNAEELIVTNKNKSNPCNLPDRDLKDYADMYSKASRNDNDVTVQNAKWALRAHNMDFQLRPGETIVRSVIAEGSYHFTNDWVKLVSQYSGEWKGYPVERFDPFRSYGNGQWKYEPNLSSESSDFKLGVCESSSLQQNKNGLVGVGSAIFNIASPYIFCGEPNINGDTVTHANGAWIEVKGAGELILELTDPLGNWHTILETNGDFEERVDVSDKMSGRYNSQIKITLGEACSLNHFCFDGKILTSPMCIPRLEAGDNKMEFRSGDKFNLSTIPSSTWVDFRAGTNIAENWYSADNAEVVPCGDSWQRIKPILPNTPVVVCWPFTSPKNKPFAWIYVHASMKEGPHDEEAKTAKLEWSLNGSDWQLICDTKLSNSLKGWDAYIDGEFQLETPAKDVWIRISSDTPIGGFEFHGHCLQNSEEDTLEIVHEWEEEGQVSTLNIKDEMRYNIHCRSEPKNHKITMHNPSRLSNK